MPVVLLDQLPALGPPEEPLVEGPVRMGPVSAPVSAEEVEGPLVLTYGVDALSVSFYSDVADSVREQVAAAVEVLREKGKKATADEVGVSLCGTDWVVTAGPGKDREALLGCPTASLKLARESQPNPNLLFQAKCEVLWDARMGYAGFWRWAERLAQMVHDQAHGAPQPPPVSLLTRIDLTVDTLDIPFLHDQEQGPVFVAAATKMAGHNAPKDAREPGRDGWLRDSHYPTGWSFGKGKHVARVYAKAEEILKQSDKRWFVAVWREHGGVEVDLKRDCARIWRVEHQLKRERIKQLNELVDDRTGELLNLDTLEGLEAAFPWVWAYCCGTPTSSGWLSWRHKEGSDWSERSRWRHRDEWLLVQRAFGERPEGTDLLVAVEKSHEADAYDLLRMLRGVAEKLASKLPYEVHRGTWGGLLAWVREEGEKQYAEDGVSFEYKLLRLLATEGNEGLRSLIKENSALAGVKRRGRKKKKEGAS